MANWFGNALTAGESVERILGWEERIRAVTAEQVKTALNTYIAGQNHIDATLTGSKGAGK